PVYGHLVDRAALRRLDHVHGHAVFAGLLDHFRVVGIQEDLQLLFIQLVFARGAGHFFDAVGIVKQNAQIADTADAGLGAHRRHARFNPRVAEDALFRLAGFPVEIDLLVGAAGYTHPPATALVLINQHDAVFFPLVDGATRAGRYAG